MVPPQHKEVLRVLDFVCEKKAYCLERLLATVDVISQEQVVRLWREAAVFEQSEQIVILAVYITCAKTTPGGLCQPDRPTFSHKTGNVPHILMGASNSRRMGWLIKISLAFVQRYFISYSCSCTGLPGRFPRTVTWSGEARGTARGAVGGQLTFKKTVDDRVKIDLRCSIRHVYVSSLGVVKGLGGLGWSCGSSKIIQTVDGLSVAETGWRGGEGREGERCERRGYDCTNTGSFAAATLKRNESGVGGQPAANAWMSRKSARLRKRVSGGLQ